MAKRKNSHAKKQKKKNKTTCSISEVNAVLIKDAVLHLFYHPLSAEANRVGQLEGKATAYF